MAGQPIKPSPSLAVVYFGVGFTIGGAFTMTALTLLRPLLANAGTGLMRVLLFAPLPSGGSPSHRAAGGRDRVRKGSC